MSVLDDLLAADTQPWPPWLADHLSSSSINDYLQCPEAFRLKRVLKHPTRTNSNMVVGHAMGVAHAEAWRHRIATGELLPLPDVLDKARAAFRYKVDAEGGADEIDWDDAADTLVDTAIRITEAYYPVAATIEPIAVEQEILYEVPGCPPVTGYSDAVEVDGAVELKSAKTLTRKVEPWWRAQALIYAAALAVPVSFHVVTKAQAPKVTTPETDEGLLAPVETARAELLVRSVADDLRGRDPERVWPGHGLTHTFACHGCNVRPVCAYWGNA